MAQFLTMNDSVFMNDLISNMPDLVMHRPDPVVEYMPRFSFEGKHRPGLIPEEDEGDEAAPPVDVPRWRSNSQRQSHSRTASLSRPFSRGPHFWLRDSSLSRQGSGSSTARSVLSRQHVERSLSMRTQKTSSEATQSSRPQSARSDLSIASSRVASVRQPPIFRRLSKEIYACIMRQLEILHFGKGANSCTACYLRDLYSLSLSSRVWEKAARAHMYGTLWVPAPDKEDRGKVAPTKPTRIKALRKILREKSAYGNMVREIKAYELQQAFAEANYNEAQEIVNDLASIVMACPNLEKLTGFHWIYRHEFDRLNHALSTRPHLKERAWLISQPINHQPISLDKSSGVAALQLYPGPTELFLHHHDNCSNLKTLFLHGEGTGIMDFRSFVATFRKLQHLEDLHLSNFSAADFNDRTLAAIPPLKRLRLDTLDGVTDKGLMRFSRSPAAKGLAALSLVDLEIIDLLIVTSFFEHCTSLTRFTIVQEGSPGIAPFTPVYRPVFSSPSLRYLHWDILMPGAATEELAISIAEGTFPLLRRLRAPADHGGHLQDVCRPVSNIKHASDAQLLKEQDVAAEHDSKLDEDYFLTSATLYPVSSMLETVDEVPPIKPSTRTLPAARQAAQSRIDGAALLSFSSLSDSGAASNADTAGTRSRGSSLSSISSSVIGTIASTHNPNHSYKHNRNHHHLSTAMTNNKPHMQVVIEEEGVVHSRYVFSGSMGSPGSRVEYWLEPDVPGSDEAVVRASDLLGVRMRRTVRTWAGSDADGVECAGMGAEDAGGRWHRPRRRIVPLELGDFF
ncbi:hypothetical protein IWX50DRAFT_653132 [Phyllosticta citricarpa]